MSYQIPICQYVLETNQSDKIFYSYRCVSNNYPLHGHDFYELELIIHGCGKQWVNNTCIPINPGSLYLCTPFDVHRIEADEPLHIVSIHFLEETAQQINFDQIQDAWSMQLDQQTLDFYSALAFSILEEKKQNIPYYQQQMLSVATLMLVHLLRNGSRHSAAPANHNMQKILKYICENYSNPNLRLKDVAQISGLSVCHFSTIFNHVVGCGFSEYLCSYRLHRATLLLSECNLSITEISYEVGFSTLSHFFRCFHATYGCTPKQYRQQHTTSDTLPLSTPQIHWSPILASTPEPSQ